MNCLFKDCFPLIWLSLFGRSWVFCCCHCFSGFFGCAECGILIPRPGIEPVPLQWKRGAQTTGPLGNSPPMLFFSSIYVPNVMGFFYFTVMQNQRFYYHTGINVLQGHEKVLWDMQDMMDNWRVRSSHL